MTPEEINETYPVRFDAWSFDRMTGRWIAEMSDLIENLDPWKRPLTPFVRKLRDTNERELIGWIHNTSVKGNQIELVIYND
jgi:hypothetical protein